MPSDMQAPVYLVPTQVGDLGLELFHVQKATRSWVEPLAAGRLPVCPATSIVCCTSHGRKPRSTSIATSMGAECPLRGILRARRPVRTRKVTVFVPVAQAPWWWATTLTVLSRWSWRTVCHCPRLWRTCTNGTRSTCGLLWNKNFAMHSNTRSVAMAVPTLTRPFLLLHLSGAHY